MVLLPRIRERKTMNMDILGAYNYLFYNAYQIAQKSKKYKGSAVSYAIVWVGGCFFMNIGSLMLIIEKATMHIIDIDNSMILSLVFSAILFALLYFYYSNKERYIRVVAKYQNKERNEGSITYHFIIVITYYIVSVLLIMVASMYKNDNGIFNL